MSTPMTTQSVRFLWGILECTSAALFKKTFRFTGGEITGEFLMSTGYLPGTHNPDCPTFTTIAALDPPWMQVPESFWNR